MNVNVIYELLLFGADKVKLWIDGVYGLGTYDVLSIPDKASLLLSANSYAFMVLIVLLFMVYFLFEVLLSELLCFFNKRYKKGTNNISGR